MNKTLITLLLLASAGAYANDAADELRNRTAFTGGMTRAEVQAAYATAKANGTLPETGEAASMKTQASASTRDRAEVKAEAIQAARAHQIHELF